MVLRPITGGGGGFLAGRQIVPLNYEAEVSQRLLEASLANDVKSALECLNDPFVDVNYVGAVCLKVRKTDVVLSEESPGEVRVDYDEFKTDATALFVAANNGNASLVRKLLNAGADPNLRLFRGFSPTAASRENHLETLKILLKAGACQLACEEALLEACSHGHSSLVQLLMGSDLIRPHVAVHAHVTACCMGFVEVVDVLIKCGVDVNAYDRVLLRSCRPSLHANADCNGLVAAIVSRQASTVRLLLEAGAETDITVQLGAWSWDVASGEEFRVGAGMGEPYPIAWCGVEYFEASGSILQMLLKRTSPNVTHLGRTLLHHAILCDDVGAVKTLLKCGAHVDTPVRTTQKTEFRPIHMAARLGSSAILECLLEFCCDLNSRTEAGETALMISAGHKRESCLQVLVKAGADFGSVNTRGQSANTIATSNHWSVGFQQAVLAVIRNGFIPTSSDRSIFSPLRFTAQSGDVLALEALIGQPDIDLDEQDEEGFSAVMVAAVEGHVDSFRLLVYASADVKLQNKQGETALTLYKQSKHRDLFEKVMLEFALEKGNRIGGGGGFYALHCAARRGDLPAVRLLASKGYDVDALDGDGNTPLMLAAREGNGKMCDLLISYGCCLDAKNAKGETALSLARAFSKRNNEGEDVILNALARKTVTSGSKLQKHTKGGKGSPHPKLVRMIESNGILRWGNSSRRNVTCRGVELGPSSSFVRNRRRKSGGNDPGIFRVVTSKNKEVHFVCEGGAEAAELWVRGIRLVTEEAVSGKNK